MDSFEASRGPGKRVGSIPFLFRKFSMKKVLIKYLIFSFLRSGVEAKRGVELCHLTRNASKFGGKWGVECLDTKLPLSTLLHTGYSVKLKKIALLL